VARCWSAAEYAATVRQCLIAFKEHRRRDLAAPLAAMLSPVLRAAVPGPAVLVPVPATAAALRRRGFDHVAELTTRLAASLPGCRVARVLSAGRRPDSAGLTIAQRRLAAAGSLTGRVRACARLRSVLSRWPDTAVLLVDDIVTTGATLRAARQALTSQAVPVAGAVTVAATARRSRRFVKIHPRSGGDIGQVTR
jgi:predicted amidophosphoribosyltransferase